MSNFDLKKIQSILKSFNFDAWLFYDFRASNDIAHNILNILKDTHLTRRFYYLIPQNGEPVKIVNGIEANNLKHLPGLLLKYSSHESLTNHLKNTLAPYKTIAMEYIPFNSIPYISKVDAGTIEQIKTFNVDIKTSADMTSMLDAVWTKEQYEENIPNAKKLYEIAQNAFVFIKNEFEEGNTISEYDVQQYIMGEFAKNNMFTDFPPIVGVNGNAANPHYGPTSEIFKPIKKDDFVLIDLWAKPDNEAGVWSDITWVGYMGKSVPEKFVKVFNIVAEARDAALNLIMERFNSNKEVRGYEADNAARKVITDAGYGEFFIHRTGHSITTELHGSGSHLDNFETKDERLLLPSTSFSIEPGIYLPDDFGVRSEIDVYISEDGKVEVTGGAPQTEIIPILK